MEFQIGCPIKLRLLGYSEARVADEHHVHRVLRNLHHQGEWFSPEGDMLRLMIARLGELPSTLIYEQDVWDPWVEANVPSTESLRAEIEANSYSKRARKYVAKSRAAGWLWIMAALLLSACDPGLRGEVAFFTDSTGEFAAYQLVHQLGARTEDVPLAEQSDVLPGRAYLASFPASIAGAALVRDREFFLARAAALRAHHAIDVAVVMLGTNDVCGAWRPDETPAAMRALVDALGVPVLWLALPPSIDCPQLEGGELERVTAWNAMLEMAAQDAPGLTIVEPLGLSLADGLHFTPQSQRDVARLFVRALDAMSMAPLPPSTEPPTPDEVSQAITSVLRANLRLRALVASR